MKRLNIKTTSVEELTGVGEALGGRLKTLHPLIHAGILADLADEKHREDLLTLGAEPIGMVVCNLYPFATNPSVELIDIGGPAMIRAAAKNYENVAVVIDPDDYEEVLAELKENREGQHPLSLETRKRLAKKVFEATTKYDAQISTWLSEASSSTEETGLPEQLPEKLQINLTKSQTLRYGENPHQQGALYDVSYESNKEDSFLHNMELLSGKELSYLNVYDTTAGWLLTNQLSTINSSAPHSAVIIKHANPCGVAIATDIGSAFERAHECDTVSAFGGVVALSSEVKADVAKAMSELFLEVIIAPGYETDALEILRGKKNLRLLTANPPSSLNFQLRSVENMVLLQTPDGDDGRHGENIKSGHDKKGWQDWEVVTSKKPSEKEWEDLIFAEKVAAATSSNAIVIAKDLTAVGIGAGQQNRRDASNIAAEKAGNRAHGGVLASDGFFPFADALEGAIESGCSAVIQPGGSINDEKVIDAAEKAGLAMLFTGKRHFRH